MAGFKYFLALLILCASTDGAKILVVFPFPSKSHSILGDGLAQSLLDAGHEVTYVTSFPRNGTHPNMTQVDISDNLKTFPSDYNQLQDLLDKKSQSIEFNVFFEILTTLSKTNLYNENLQKLMKDKNQKFDLVIIEWMFSDVYCGLSAVFECPYIWFYSADPQSTVLTLIDDVLNPAYNPTAMSHNIPPFTFWQRLQELFSQAAFTLFGNMFLVPFENQLYDEVFSPVTAKKGISLPPFGEVRFNASLMLGNSHVTVGSPTRLPQSYKPIGGYHIDPNVKHLPEDLKVIMDNAKNGVIYFSMGSVVKSKEFPEKIRNDLLNMFGGLNYTVIWKFEEDLSDVPKNVHIFKWVPQTSVLSHPNCILFITHGGLLSTLETVYFGVPTIGIPIQADQMTNVLRAVQAGYALKIDISYDVADDLEQAIEEVLGNPIYAEKVKELSEIFKDRPASPRKELVHWVEHVIRTRGAPHLRSPALLVPWYQKMYLDLLAALIVAYYILKFVAKRLCCPRKSTGTSIFAKEKKNN